MPESGVDREAVDEIVKRNGWALAILSTYLGAAIIYCHIESGARRWTAAVWEYALQVPGSPASWGAVILSAGLMLLVGAAFKRRRIAHLGHRIAFFWCCGVAGAQLFSMLDDPTRTANPLGVGLWTYLAFMFLSRARLTEKRFYV